jgi:heme A synthase
VAAVRGAPGTTWRGQGADGALIWSMFGLLLFVATSGAVTSLGDTLFPAASLGEGVRNDFLPTAHFLERLRVIHPMIAIFTALAVVRGALLISHRRPQPVTRKLAVALCVLVVGQLVVGALNLALAAPVPFQLIHLFVADLVWIAMVLLAASALATTVTQK